MRAWRKTFLGTLDVDRGRGRAPFAASGIALEASGASGGGSGRGNHAARRLAAGRTSFAGARARSGFGARGRGGAALEQAGLAVAARGERSPARFAGARAISRAHERGRRERREIFYAAAFFTNGRRLGRQRGRTAQLRRCAETPVSPGEKTPQRRQELRR